MVISLPLPPSINATYKRSSTSFYKSSEAKQWEKDAYLLIKHKWKQKPLTGDILLTLMWYFADKRRDISSGLKIVEDILQLAGVYENDRQIHHEISTKAYDKKNPRVEIRVEQI